MSIVSVVCNTLEGLKPTLIVQQGGGGGGGNKHQFCWLFHISFKQIQCNISNNSSQDHAW